MSAPVDRIVRLARQAEPPPLDDIAARRLVDRALASAIVTPRPVRWPRVVAAVAFAGMTIAIVWLVARAPAAAPPVEPVPEVLRLALPTGDRLVATGARFDLEEVTPATRRVRVYAGAMVFDVARAAPQQRFAVTTPHAVVVATGTVFSVTVGATTSVHVYEGAVEVTRGGAMHALAAGTSWSSDAAIVAGDPAPLVEAAMAAATAHAAAAPVVTAIVEPPVEAKHEPPEPVAKSRPVPSERPPEPTIDTMLARARAHVAGGRYAEALAAISQARQRGARGAGWWLVEADALRGSGRAEPAADAFDMAAGELSGTPRVEAGFTAAYLRFHDLGAGEAALTSLDAVAADADGSPLAERALGLRVQILASLGRTEQAAQAASSYLVRFPRGGLVAYMRKLAR